MTAPQAGGAATEGRAGQPEVGRSGEAARGGGGRVVRGLGRPGFRGRRLLSISGDLNRPGVYEVPIGMPLGELIDLAGGVRGERGLGAVAPSGPSGGLIAADAARGRRLGGSG